MSRTWIEVTFLGAVAALVTWWASGLIHPELFAWKNMNVWFESDIPRVFKNMTVRGEGHGTTFKHPLFPLLVWPSTTALTALTGDAKVAVRLLLSLNAALCMAILVRLLARIGTAPLDRWLAGAFFITSAAFLFWFGVPETFPFSATSIIIGLWAAVVASEAAPRTAALVALGVGSFAITVTNIAILALALASGFWVGHSRNGALALTRRLATVMMLVLLCTATLAVVQKQYFGGAGLFFNVFSLAKERQFVVHHDSSDIMEPPLILILGTAVASDWIMVPNIPASPLDTFKNIRLSVPVYSFQQGMAGSLQVGATTLFVLVSGYSLLAIVRRDRMKGEISNAQNAVLLTTGAGIVAFLSLHMIYGAEVFLYAAHMLPLITVLLAIGLTAANSVLLRVSMLALVLMSMAYNVPAVVRANAEAAAANS